MWQFFIRNEQLERALQCAEQACEVEPGSADYLDTYAFVLYKLEKYELAWGHLMAAKDLGTEISDDLAKAIKKKL